MEEYSEEEKKFLLKLARNTIEYYFSTSKKFKIAETDISLESLKRKRSAFVTLTINNSLRGCIGSLEPKLLLYEEIIDKSFSAAFRDFRFEPLKKDELNNIKIEISILTEPQIIQYKDEEELLAKIKIGRDGIVIKKDGFSATYLPSVWKEINDKEEFLSNLCHKAGLQPNAWKNNAEVSVYNTVDFSE